MEQKQKTFIYSSRNPGSLQEILKDYLLSKWKLREAELLQECRKSELELTCVLSTKPC